MRALAALLGLLLLRALPVVAADITVNATIDPARMRVGEAADLAFTVQGASGTPAPQIGAVDGVAITYVGPATQLSIVNGKMSSSITHRFRVIGQQPGRFSIGPVAVEVEGKRYDSNALTFEVVAAAAPAPQGATGAQAPAGDSDLALTLSAPKSTLYLRERLPIGIALRVGSVRVTDVHYPVVAGDGFAIAPLAEPTQRREQTPRGIVQVLDFETTLTPLKSGTLVIGPAKLELAVIERGRGRDAFFDRFFSGDPFGSRRPRELASTPLTLEVLPLPDAGRPADFSGAVGQFDFDVEVAPRALTAGDPVTISMKIRGAGALEGVSAPAVVASDSWRAYPVQAAGLPSTPAPRPHAADEKAFEQVVIPQQAGALVLPELRFSYFDPTAGAYRTISRGGIAIDVQPAAAVAAAPVVGAPAASPAVEASAPELLGRDIVFIKDTPGDLRPIGTRLVRSPLFWAWQPLPLLLWGAAVLYDRRRRRLSGDPRYARFTRAGREARRAIAAARQALDAGDRARVYDAIASALHAYLAAKLDLPPGSVSAESVGARLRSHGLAPALAAELDAVLASCESARFAPGAHEDGDLQRTLARAEAVVRALEQERRLGAPAAIAITIALLGVLGSSVAGVGAQPPAAPSAADSPNTIFFGGNKLYGEGRYAEAAAEYERIVAAGLESGTLYFNLGNAYFKAGDLGHALLAYERARRLIPRDPDLRANQRFARSLTGAEAGVPWWTRLVFPLAERATTDELVLVVSLLYTALLLVLAARRLAPDTARGFTVAASVTGVMLALVLTSAGYRLATLELPEHAVVIASQETAVRFEPAASGTTHYSTKPGTVLRVLGEREGWAQVAREDGMRGWIERSALANVDATR